MSTTTTHASSGAGEGESPTDLAARFEAKREDFVPDHEFKSHPSVFWPAARGEKTFEYRRDDRGGYEVGQTVRLRCYTPGAGYTPVDPLDRVITNILRGGEFELPAGYCILSLAPVPEARDMARAGAAGGADWTCAARRQGAAGGNDPADCDWPVCGCDPYADKVVAALQESGHLAPPPPAQQGSSSPPLTAERGDLWELAVAIDNADHGYSIRLTSLTEDGSTYTLDLCDGSELLTFDHSEDAREYANQQRSLARAKAALAFFSASLPAGTGSADEGTDLGAPAVVQTGWHCTATDGKPRYNGEWGERYLLTWSERTATAGINCIDGEWSHGQEIALTGMDWWCWIDAPPYSDAEGDSAAAEGQAPGVFVEGYLNDLCLAGKHPAQQQTSTSPTSPQEGEVKSPQIDPVGEAKALLEGLQKDRTPEQHIAYRRWQASEPKFEQVAELCLHRAEQIEAALATLHASQDQAGEVRDV